MKRRLLSAARGCARRCYGSAAPRAGQEGQWQENFEDYRSAVSSALVQSEAHLRNAHETRYTKRERQAQELQTQLEATIKGTSDSVSKLRRVNEIFMEARDNQLSLATQAENLMQFLMGFSPFPARRAGYQRHEFMLTIYRHTRDMGERYTSSLVVMMLTALARAPPEFHTKALFFVAEEVVGDVKSEGLDMNAHILAAFFKVTSRVDMQPAAGKRAHELFKEYAKTPFYTPTTSFFMYLLSTLTRADLIEEALYVMNAFEKMPVSNLLGCACMEVCMHSKDPLSVFSMYKVLFVTADTQLRPTTEVFSVMLRTVALLEEGMRGDLVQLICNEMKRTGVHTADPDFLNRLALSLFAVHRAEQGADLVRQMGRRGIDVWPLTEEAVPPHLRDEERLNIVGAHRFATEPPRAPQEVQAEKEELRNEKRARQEAEAMKGLKVWKRGAAEPASDAAEGGGAAAGPYFRTVKVRSRLKVGEKQAEEVRRFEQRPQSTDERAAAARKAKIDEAMRAPLNLRLGDKAGGGEEDYDEQGFDVGKIVGL